MIEQGEIISYLQMCAEEGVNLQRGMNFRLKGGASVILMSTRSGAPYSDRTEANGKILIYEGHDVPTSHEHQNPKTIDQPERYTGGSLTQNGKFYKAAMAHKQEGALPEQVRVYEKIRNGIWVYNGLFNLVDAWQEHRDERNVFRFKLELIEEPASNAETKQHELVHTRLIPTHIKLEVWTRDRGKCVVCGSENNLHFDHIIPYSKGGSSIMAENIQLLCARHNLAKHDRIE